MTLARPEWLWLLTVAPLLAAWVARGKRLRVRDWSALAQRGRPIGSGLAGWLGACVCLVVALAGPRWGRSSAPPLPPGHDVVLLVDVSRSMAVEDAVPNRLGVALEAAEGLVSALGTVRGDRAAVVAFAGRGVVRCPLTENLGAVVESLKRLRPDDVRPGGTDLGAALDAALDAFDDQEHAQGRAIVLFSDGEDLAGHENEAVNRLRLAGVVVHAVAIGDAQRGHRVPSGRGGEALTYHGQRVLSRRTDPPLVAVANATGGAVVPLGLASADLATLYQQRIAPIALRRREAGRVADRPERYAVFVIVALGLGLAGLWPGWRPGARALVLIGTATALGAGPGGGSAADAITAGRAAFAAGRFEAALDAFEHAVRLDPRSAVAHYDAAATLYPLGRLNAARVHYLEARARADAALRTKIDYGLGNSALGLGDVTAALTHYDDCLASKAPGPALDAVRRDAAINRRFAEEQARGPSPAPESPPDKKGSSSEDEKPPGGPRPDAGGAATGPPTGRRGAGGAGGSGAPPRGGDPQERLDSALENIRAARSRRLPDEPPLTNRDDDRKDW